MTKSPFPKLSQAWRFVRIAGSGFGAQALAGVAHVAWADRTAIAAAVVGAVEVAYRKAFPAGKLSGELANWVAAYRKIATEAKAAETVVEPVAKAVEPAPPATAAEVVAQVESVAQAPAVAAAASAAPETPQPA